MTIGQLAKKAEVNVETIRYYQRIQLLTEPPRPSQGYRAYGQDSLDTLSFIRRSKALGFSLADIRELLTLQQRQNSCHEICALANKNLVKIRQRIQDLKEMEKNVSALVESCKTSSDCLILKSLEQPASAYSG